MTANAHNLDFIFNKCGFDWVPPEIDRTLLFNVAYELRDRSMKLYILDRSRSFLHKIDQNRSITRQYRGDASTVDPIRLTGFLGESFDFNDLLIDTVEDDVYYLLLERASAAQYIKLLGCVCSRFGIARSRLIEVVNRINRVSVVNVFECCTRRAVSGIKIPIAAAGKVKIYARPFLTGNGYELPDHARELFSKIYSCDPAQVEGYLRFLWVSSELLTDRVVLTTQDDGQRGV